MLRDPDFATEGAQQSSSEADPEAFQAPPAAYTKKMPVPREVYVIDFFAGCGGMSYGFANTRQSHNVFKILAGLDINAEALATYQRNLPAARAVEADIAALAENPERLLELLPEFSPQNCRPLVFIGCAPCQGFSAHRKKDKREDIRNSLMLAFAQVCAKFEPDVVVMENVPEILGGRFSGHYDSAREVLLASGYDLTQDVLDLSLYGVPQRRRRAIVLGSRLGKIKLPTPIFTRDTAPTVRDAISHLAPISAGEVDASDPFHRAPSHTDRILKRIANTPPDGGDRRDLPAKDQLDCHSSIDEGRTPGFTDVYGRLRWDTPSVTITAKSSTPSCGRFLHPEQHRNISVREAAILQGFPQSFQFEGPFVNRYRQIGEAVPPLFARSLAWSVLDHLTPPEEAALAVQASVKSKREHASDFSLDVAVVDGFCGAGGIALGFQTAGFATALGFDIDADAVSTFRHNVRSPAIRVGVADSRLPHEIVKAIADKPFVLTGGPPCQGFSQQRRGQDDDARNNLVVAFARLVGEIGKVPLAVVLENVTYLDSPRGRKVFAEYTSTIEALGYQIFRHDLNSADFGVPQLRRRIVSVALLPEIAKHYEGPEPLTASRWPTVGEFLNGLPPAAVKVEEADLGNHVVSAEGALNKRRISYVDMGSGRMAIPEQLQLKCHLKYGGHLDVYGRLDWFSQARTITGGFDSFTRGEYAHPFMHRSITAREAARIQGFPDWFAFEGNRASVRRQIGNAVPPPLGAAVGIAIQRALKKAGAA